MKTYNDFAQLAYDNDLKCGHVTKAINGYPTPYARAFIYGFDTYAQAEEFKASNGGEITLCRQKDGWQVWEGCGGISRPLLADDFLTGLGDNYAQLTREDIFTELGNLDKNMPLLELSGELQRLTDWAGELATAERTNLVTIITPSGELDFVDEEMMSYHEDVTTLTVGVFF
jgi:hypothetical protein